MTTRSLRIAEVADQAGISTATVRYYERIGVLPPPPRAGNGYRVYDQRTVERLRFIGRAKQLGCNLEEISDLVTAWDGGECGPVQDRLKELVAAKLDAARAEIVELVTFTADLQRAAASLDGHRPAGPCDDRCGCVADGPTPTPGSVDQAPVARATSFPVALTAKLGAGGASPDPPLVCTLDAALVPSRIDDWAALTAAAVARTPIPGGVRLDLGDRADVAAAARLAAAEQDCCRFFAFRLTIDGRGVGLELTAPDAALDVVHAMGGGTGMSGDGREPRTGGTGAVVGAAGLACVACCAGPIAAALAAAGIGVATVAGVALFGAAGLVVALLTVPAVGRWRRQRRRRPGAATASAPDGPVLVAAPTVRRRAAESDT